MTHTVQCKSERVAGA